MPRNRARILDVALELFNAAGTAPISTNHITAAAGISPGNLYYHFRNKEQIVQALFERCLTHASTSLRCRRIVHRRLPTCATSSDVLWEHPFAYRELAALLRRDEILRERWLDVRRRGDVGFREVVAAFVTAGVVPTPGDPGAVDRLADVCWLTSEFWLPNLEINGEAVDATQLDRGVALMLQLLNPTLDPAQLSKEILNSTAS